jgi:hypothetical protein
MNNIKPKENAFSWLCTGEIGSCPSIGFVVQVQDQDTTRYEALNAKQVAHIQRGPSRQQKKTDDVRLACHF